MFVGLKDIQLEVSDFGLSISQSGKTPPLRTGPSILPVKQAEILLTPYSIIFQGDVFIRQHYVCN